MSAMKIKIGRLLSAIPIILMLLSIFSFSSQSGTKSSGLSHRVCMVIAETHNKIGNKNYTESELEELAESLQFYVRKTAHLSEYALLSILFFIHFCFYKNLAGKRYMIALVTTFICACLDEFHQLYVPGRAGLWTDVCIDSAGAFIGLLMTYLIKRTLTKTRKTNIMK